MDTSGGRPTIIGVPEAVSPFNKDLREILTRLVITCDKVPPLGIREFSQAYQRNDKLFEPELRIPEIIHRFSENGPVGRRFHMPDRIPKILLHNTLLTLRTLREYDAEF